MVKRDDAIKISVMRLRLVCVIRTIFAAVELGWSRYRCSKYPSSIGANFLNVKRV